jgi:uncharacterized protein (UPF0332 family)
MPFRWTEFFALAQQIAGTSGAGYTDEASNRAAVSRAYYAAFCSLRNYAASQLSFQPQGTPRDHNALRLHLHALGGEWATAARYLQELRLWRNQCDYDDEVPNLNELTRLALNRAEAILQRLP